MLSDRMIVCVSIDSYTIYGVGESDTVIVLHLEAKYRLLLFASS